MAKKKSPGAKKRAKVRKEKARHTDKPALVVDALETQQILADNLADNDAQEILDEVLEESGPRCPIHKDKDPFLDFSSSNRIFCWDCNKFLTIPDSQPATPQKPNLFRRFCEGNPPHEQITVRRNLKPSLRPDSFSY